MIWDQLTSPQLGALNRDIPVILPVSATEQHGPHLPLATDRMIGEYFCQQLDLSIPDQVLILPIVSVGYSQHHMEFPGSLSITHSTFIGQIEDILDSVVSHGFKNLIILNSHGGNLAVGQLLLEKLGAKYSNSQLVFATWWKIVADKLFELNETGPGGVGHAGEFETSLMLKIAPSLVHLDRMEGKKNRKSYDWTELDMLRGSSASLYRSMGDMTENGVFGDPTNASTEKGQQIIDLVVPALKNITLDLMSNNK